MQKPANISQFVALGFEPISEWVIRNDKIKLQSLSWQDQSGWLYAFVIGDWVKYVGLTTRILRSRMDDYSYISEEQCTHKRSLIMGELQAGNSVIVYGKRYTDDQELFENELKMRQEYDLEWNRI